MTSAPSAGRARLPAVRVPRRRRLLPGSPPASVVLASLLLFLVSLLWAALIPAFRGPDELQHVNSVIRVAEGGGWPAPGDVRIQDEVLEALRLSGYLVDERRTALPGAADPPEDSPEFVDEVPTPVADRASFAAMDDGDATGYTIDQMTQHPPGYYAVAAVVYDVLQAREWRFDRALFLLRALTALVVALTVPTCCYVAARALSGSETLGRMAAFVPLLIPQLQYMSGVVNNDGATIATTAVVWTVLLTLTGSGPTRRRLLLLAVAIGAACWTKGTAVSLLPVVPVAIAIAYHRHVGGSLRRWGLPALGATAGTLALAFVLGGWWWAVNVIRYGRLQPSAYPIPEGDPARLGPLEFGLVFLRRIHRSFFGDLGVGETPALHAMTLALAAVFVVACAVGLFSRHRLAERVVIVFSAAVVVGVLAATTYSAHLQSGRIPGIQGRYLFVLLVPIAALVVIGLGRIARLFHLGDRWLTVVCALAGLGVTTFGLVLAFRLYYEERGRPVDEALDRFLGWASWPPDVLGGLAAALLVAAVALAWVVARRSNRRTPEVQVTETA